MKFGYSTSVYRFRPLSEAMEGIARAGFCAVELITDRPHAFPEDLTAAQITSLNECLQERKLKVCNLHGAAVTALGEGPGPSWLEEDWQDREKRIRYTLDCMRLAAAMGVPHVSTGGGGPIPETMNRMNALRLMVANLQRIMPLCKKLGVKLLIQPQPRDLIETSEHALELLKELELNECLRINFDVGHLFCVGEDPCEAWGKLKAYVAHVHLEDIPANRDHRHVQLGEGIVDIVGFLKCVEESGYTGCVTIKLDAHDQRGDDVVLASAKYLKDKGYMVKGCEAPT